MPKTKTARMVMVADIPYQRDANGDLKPLRGRTDWNRLDAMTDQQATAAAEADPDAKPMTDDEWARAELAMSSKISIGIRLDADIVAWFKQQGMGYQTRINAVLRRYVEAQTKDR